MQPQTERRAPRLGFADAIRGPAALAVMAWHLYDGPMRRTLDAMLPELLLAPLRRGFLGSRLFFVLAGFGLALSLRRAADARAGLGVLARQQARLAPAYWVVVALAFADRALPSLWHAGRGADVPSVPGLLAHLVYLAQPLGFDPLLTTFWFLSVDVQLSVLAVGLFVLATALGRARAWGLGREGWFLALGAPFVALGLAHAFAPWAPHYLFVAHAPLLGAGVLAAWALTGAVRARSLWVLVGALAATGAATGRLELLVGAATAAALFAAGRVPALGRVRGPAALRWVGQRSYCLYLVHYLVGFRVLNGAHKLWGDGPVVALLAYAGAIAASLAAAAVLEATVQSRARAWGAALAGRAAQQPAPAADAPPAAAPSAAALPAA